MVPAAGAMALSAVLGWYFRGAQSDPYTAISRTVVPTPEPAALPAPEADNPYASLIPPDSAPAPAQPVEPRPGE